jgi:hypothetical protein
MNPIYQAQHYQPGDYRNTYTSEDFDTEAEAIAAVEQAGGGSVVKFAREHNMPYCKPDIVHRSIWLKVYENGEWRQPNIHTA